MFSWCAPRVQQPNVLDLEIANTENDYQQEGGVADDDEIKSLSQTPAFQREKMYRRVMSFLSIAAYVVSGLTIVIVNKSIIRDHGLHAPALVSSMGALFTAMTTRFLVFIGQVERTEVDLPPLAFALRRAFPVGVLAAGSLCFGNMSYIYLDAGFIQMLKAGTPALLLFMLSLLKIEKISALGASLALTMVCGSALATLQQPNINPLGLVIQALSQACEVLQCTAIQFFLQKLGFNAFDAGYYLAPAVAMCCLLVSMAAEWPDIIRQQQVWLLCTQLPSLLASGSIGIVVNLSSLLVIKYTSSLLAKLLVIVRSSLLVLFFVMWGEDFTWLQMTGYFVTITAFSGYSALKATEVEKEQDEEIRKMVSMEEGAQEKKQGEQEAQGSLQKLRSLDLTSGFFWFAFLIVLGCAYQAYILGVIERSGGIFGHPYALGTLQVPPSPFISQEHDQGFGAPVQSSVKALWVDKSHFLLHSHSTARLQQREDSSYLSSAWLIASTQFGTVQLRAMHDEGQSRWLDCNFQLTLNDYEACDFWMTPERYDAYGAREDQHPTFILRHAGRVDGNNSVMQNGSTHLMWGTDPIPFHVSEWVPEGCGFRPQPPPVQYETAANQITVTMSTHLKKYADSIKFRQVLTSIFTHLKETEFYIKEFLIIDDWFDGRSVALNGTQLGPTVEESRRENLAFFPGCVGVNASLAEERMPQHRCTFLYQSKEQQGQARATNILLDLMKTEFWLHIDMDSVLQQDFYISGALQPMFEQREKCASVTTTTTTVIIQVPKSSRRWPVYFEEDIIEEEKERKIKEEKEAKKRALEEEKRRLSNPDCQVVAGVQLRRPEHAPSWGRISKPYKIEKYHMPTDLKNDTYVDELLNLTAAFDKESPQWEDFQKATSWPFFSWRSGLFNLTHVKMLEATGGQMKGHFAELEDFRQSELEFALRWARSGSTHASLMHGCWSTGG